MRVGRASEQQRTFLKWRIGAERNELDGAADDGGVPQVLVDVAEIRGGALQRHG